MRNKEEILRMKLQEKEVKAKEALRRGPEMGVVTRNTQPEGSSRGRRFKSQDLGIEDKRKGKRVASSSQKIWRQKGDGGESRNTKSTEESSAKSYSNCKDHSTSIKGSGLVFNKLGSSEQGEGTDGSRGRSLPGEQVQDLRISLSGGSQGEKIDGKSSKGSRSPPPRFSKD